VQEIDESYTLKTIAYANLGVDGFFVLSGFLATYQILSTGGVGFSFCQYVWGRCKRVVIPHIVTLILMYFGLPQFKSIPEHMRSNYDVMFSYCHKTWPLSLLLLHNFIGFGGCGVHLWSVGAQMQIFILYGLVVKVLERNKERFAERLELLAMATFVGSVCFRVIFAVVFDVKFPVPAFDHPDMPTTLKDSSFYYYHTLYFPTPARLCNFTAGVLLATRMQAWVSKSQVVTWKSPKSVVYPIFAGYLALITSIQYKNISIDSWKLSSLWAALAFHGSPLISGIMVLLLYECVLSGNKGPVKSTYISRMFIALGQVRRAVPIFERMKLTFEQHNRHFFVRVGFLLGISVTPIGAVLEPGSQRQILSQSLE
jgi:peptidoglycan/LPS O-acetylase OafA/YrhL